MKERADLRPAYILKRGAYDNPGRVSRNHAGFLAATKSKRSAEDTARLGAMGDRQAKR